MCNVAFLVAAALFLYLDNNFYYHHKENYYFAWSFTYLTVVNVLLQIISGIFILYAVAKIRKVMLKGLKTQQINEKNLALHAATFVLYLLAISVDAVFFFNYQFKGTFDAYEIFIKVAAIGSLINFSG